MNDLVPSSFWDREDVIPRFYRRSDAAKNCGGISQIDLAEGAELPQGYWLDEITLFWIPEKVRLL